MRTSTDNGVQIGARVTPEEADILQQWCEDRRDALTNRLPTRSDAIKAALRALAAAEKDRKRKLAR